MDEENLLWLIAVGLLILIPCCSSYIRHQEKMACIQSNNTQPTCLELMKK